MARSASKPKKQIQAKHAPVHAPVKEISSSDFPVPQRGPIDVDKALGESPAGIEIVEKLPEQQYAEELKFGDDPVTGILSPSPDPKAAKQVYCAVNGKGAEVWDERNRRWIEFKYLPVARKITMKRKYWEVLARSRVDSFSTREVTPTPHANQDGFVLDPVTVQAAPFNVFHDPAGVKGHEWLQRVMSEF
jgi:hypothetical protein